MRNVITFAVLVAMTSGCGSQKARIAPSAPSRGASEAGPYVFTRTVGDVYVRGGVYRPGRYGWTNGMTVLDAIGAAGGVRDFATGGPGTHADRTSDVYQDLRLNS